MKRMWFGLVLLAVLVTGCTSDLQGNGGFVVRWGSNVFIGQETERDSNGEDRAVTKLNSQPLEDWLRSRGNVSDATTNGDAVVEQPVTSTGVLPEGGDTEPTETSGEAVAYKSGGTDSRQSGGSIRAP